MLKISNVYGQAGILVFITALSFIGIALPYPIFAPLILNNESNIISLALLQNFTKPVLLGILLASYPLGQFVGLPILGTLSDKVGRKKTLIITLIGTAFGYFLSAIAILNHHYILLLTSRLWTGFCEGNFAIAQAAIADISEQKNKTKYFGWLNGAIAIGYIIGPLMGGITADSNLVSWFSYELPFFMATGLAILAIFIVWGFLKETSPFKQELTLVEFIHYIRYACRSAFLDIKILQDIAIKRAMIIFLLFYLGIDLFYEFYPFYFTANWQFSTLSIAFFSGVYTLAYAISQLIFVPKVGVFFHPKRILVIVGLACGAVLIIMLLPKNHTSLYITLPILGVLISFCSTNVAVFLSNATGAHIQGKVFGTAQAFRVLGDCLLTIFAGKLAVLFIGMPIFLGGCIIIMAGIGLLISKNSNTVPEALKFEE